MSNLLHLTGSLAALLADLATISEATDRAALLPLNDLLAAVNPTAMDELANALVEAAE